MGFPFCRRFGIHIWTAFYYDPQKGCKQKGYGHIYMYSFPLMMDLFNLSYNIANIHAGTYSCDLRKC